jgi:hypothetical protein
MMTKYNPADKPKPQGGDYRPHYRKDEVDAHLKYLGILIEAQAATILLLRVQKRDTETQLSNTIKLWRDQVKL